MCKYKLRVNSPLKNSIRLPGLFMKSMLFTDSSFGSFDWTWNIRFVETSFGGYIWCWCSWCWCGSFAALWIYGIRMFVVFNMAKSVCVCVCVRYKSPIFTLKPSNLCCGSIALVVSSCDAEYYSWFGCVINMWRCQRCIWYCTLIIWSAIYPNKC